MIPPNELKAVLDGAVAAAPESSKRPKWLPFTPAYLAIIREHLDLNSLLDAAIFACLTTTFYAIARLGEFTVNAIKEFDLKKHITRSGISKTADHNGLPVTKFHLPSTKCSPNEGEDAYWAMQEGPSDPSAIRVETRQRTASFIEERIRIGGTLEYLLHGVPFEVVKTMGRWSYIQASPVLEPFT